ncbi:hypothetical protein BCR44DRAFT_398664 [Catenaria anguillulae PL171]|uniref:Uncharacterized protein n=1 Tax=Catenaria anguillulae PL171 TaxID=765915 RepID=A0A1Y2H8Y2_9FUNG|nr:hypothetical protein BCR44DRAFT_398664 [Catenaria anguillulae PL171]
MDKFPLAHMLAKCESNDNGCRWPSDCRHGSLGSCCLALAVEHGNSKPDKRIARRIHSALAIGDYDMYRGNVTNNVPRRSQEGFQAAKDLRSGGLRAVLVSWSSLTMHGLFLEAGVSEMVATGLDHVFNVRLAIATEGLLVLEWIRSIFAMAHMCEVDEDERESGQTSDSESDESHEVGFDSRVLSLNPDCLTQARAMEILESDAGSTITRWPYVNAGPAISSPTEPRSSEIPCVYLAFVMFVYSCLTRRGQDVDLFVCVTPFGHAGSPIGQLG